MNLYDILKVRKLFHQTTRDYHVEIQFTWYSLTSCGHRTKDMQHIYNILNGVKGQYDNVVSVIHASNNPYEIASVCFVLLDAKSRLRDQLFEVIYFNIFLNISLDHYNPLMSQ